MPNYRFPKQVLEILETIPNAFYVLDKAWNFVYANAQIEKLLNKSLEELVGTHFWDVFPKEKFGHLYEQFTKAGETNQMVCFLEYSPKYERWFEISVYPTNLGTAVYVSDVTVRKHTEDELVRTKEELQEFLDNAAVGIHWVNEEGTIIYVNRAELELLGYSKEEYLHHNIAEFYVNKTVLTDILHQLKSTEEIHGYEVELRCKDGTTRHVLVSSNVAWKNGRFVHTRCFTRDITSRKKNDRLLLLLNKVSQQLVTELDFDEAITTVAKSIVPGFADWFAIYLLKEDKLELLKLECNNIDAFRPAVDYRQSNPINLDKFKVNSLAWVLKIGKPVHLEHVTNSALENLAADRSQLELLQRMQLKSLIMVPMKMKGSVIGAVTFASNSQQRIFDIQDFSCAQDLVARIAFSVENVRLYNEAKALRAQQIRQKDGSFVV